MTDAERLAKWMHELFEASWEQQPEDYKQRVINIAAKMLEDPPDWVREMFAAPNVVVSSYR